MSKLCKNLLIHYVWIAKWHSSLSARLPGLRASFLHSLLVRLDLCILYHHVPGIPFLELMMILRIINLISILSISVSSILSLLQIFDYICISFINFVYSNKKLSQRRPLRGLALGWGFPNLGFGVGVEEGVGWVVTRTSWYCATPITGTPQRSKWVSDWGCILWQQ